MVQPRPWVCHHHQASLHKLNLTGSFSHSFKNCGLLNKTKTPNPSPYHLPALPAVQTHGAAPSVDLPPPPSIPPQTSPADPQVSPPNPGDLCLALLLTPLVALTPALLGRVRPRERRAGCGRGGAAECPNCQPAIKGREQHLELLIAELGTFDHKDPVGGELAAGEGWQLDAPTVSLQYKGGSNNLKSYVLS